MDKNTLILLKTDLQGQRQLINNIFQKLEQRAEGLTPDDLIRLESIAYQIHNLYTASEDLLKIIATYFENNITNTAQWHANLLTRLSQNIPGIRPAFLTEETFLILNSLRGFRHFFRHAYGANIEYDQLKINLDKALKLREYLAKDCDNFLKKIAAE
ncbi:MAG: hypothetical protein EA365_12780 [Gloeocapsa sp. DLM2.Bin57]|nr:MAG: hypothetical protein EA365_12780 [Gloeocapsa sp. DLM2.Bin57]